MNRVIMECAIITLNQTYRKLKGMGTWLYWCNVTVECVRAANKSGSRHGGNWDDGKTAEVCEVYVCLLWEKDHEQQMKNITNRRTNQRTIANQPTNHCQPTIANQTTNQPLPTNRQTNQP